MPSPSPFTPIERLESAKVAIVGGFTAGLISFGLLLIYRFANPEAAILLTNLWSGLAGRALLVNWAIASFSGSLFALTYRYAIRRNHNPQLHAGVVLAFTLVRGLAQVDAGSAIAQHYWPFLSACGESLLLFGGSAIVINIAFSQQWLKQFAETE